MKKRRSGFSTVSSNCRDKGTPPWRRKKRTGIGDQLGRCRVEEMVIGNSIKSDHSPIEMRVQWKGMMGSQERARKGDEKRSIIKWEEGGVKEFRERLEA